MLKRLVTGLADFPALWDAARRVIEANHRAQRATIRRQLGSVRGTMLDVPCGTGIFSPLFAAGDYTGVDLNEAYIERARGKYRDKRFLVMSALDLKFAEASFDAVLTVGFLHHLDEPDVLRVLAEVRRVLKPGGRLLLIEDCPTRSRWNVPGRILQSLDAGGRIRDPRWYRHALGERFEVRGQYPLRAGLWDYAVFVLQ